jgi:hypothetical protein
MIKTLGWIFLTFWLIAIIIIIGMAFFSEGNAPLRNFDSLEELQAWLDADKTEELQYDDFAPYAFELQKNAMADGYLVNINFIEVGDPVFYVLVTNSAIAGDTLYKFTSCPLGIDLGVEVDNPIAELYDIDCYLAEGQQ